MDNKLAYAVSFLVGAAVGAAASYYFAKNKFESEKDSFYETEVKPARDEYLQKTKKLIEENRVTKEKILDTYDQITENLGYVTDKAVDKVQEIKDGVTTATDSLIQDVKDNVIAPLLNKEPNAYFISGDDYADNENGYSKVPMTYYLNGIMVYDNYEPADDADELIGKENLDKLKRMIENNSDMAWIRNDDISTDFEIQLADYDFND